MVFSTLESWYAKKLFHPITNRRETVQGIDWLQQRMHRISKKSSLDSFILHEKTFSSLFRQIRIYFLPLSRDTTVKRGRNKEFQKYEERVEKSRILHYYTTFSRCVFVDYSVFCVHGSSNSCLTMQNFQLKVLVKNSHVCVGSLPFCSP